MADTGNEQRWPDWARDAQQAGARSSLSIGLPVQEKVTGALNIYATEPHAFDDDAIALAQTFAGFAAVGLANAHLYETQATLAGHMQKAMQSRAVIEQAKGIIMGERRCTSDEAFTILTKLLNDRLMSPISDKLLSAIDGWLPHEPGRILRVTGFS